MMSDQRKSVEIIIPFRCWPEVAGGAMTLVAKPATRGRLPSLFGTS